MRLKSFFEANSQAVFSLRNKITASILAVVLAIGMVASPFFTDAPEAEADEFVIAVDIGHGAGDVGAQSNGVNECDANARIGQALAAELKTYSGVKVVFTTQVSSIKDRVQSAMNQGADVIISVHNNTASATSANGSEVWAQAQTANYRNDLYTKSTALGNSVLQQLTALGFYNRGIKYKTQDNSYYDSSGSLADWFGINYWSRINGIVGIIIEHGFLTNQSDVAKLKDADWCTRIGKADAAGIANYYGLTKSTIGGTNAESSSSTGATNITDVNDVDTATTRATSVSLVTPNHADESDPVIMGTSQTTVNQMVAWFDSNNATYPSSVYSKYGAATIEDFCKIVLEESDTEGVRAEVVFAQAMKETGWFTFTGQVSASQCNFAGLGATDNGHYGADFSTYGAEGVRMGIRAQVQHLKAYASKDNLKNESVDPRFEKVTRGSATTIKALTGKWATDPSYGTVLATRVNDLLNTSYSESASGSTETQVSLPGFSADSSNVYIDGVAATSSQISGNKVAVNDTKAHTIISYTYNNSSDNETSYPTGMEVWTVSYDRGTYTAKHLNSFDNFLQYKGMSIRISSNSGIRMITGISENLKSALETSTGASGLTLAETGTVIAWADQVDGDNLTLETSGAKSGKAYQRGGSDPTYKTENNVEYYTNVLTGFDTDDASKLTREIAMRPYAKLSDSSGNTYTVYGGCVKRSIQYVAQQNVDTADTTVKDFCEGILRTCA